ncbi:MAG: HAMP domain-containing sensor histidine kinase, partial [Campylobacterota bacterium]|nr:HAMP domain-containing sensor histidine kinase [Campylobacterota bacterium]
IYFTSDNHEMMVDISRKVIDMQNDEIIGVIIAKISMYSIQEMISDKLIDFDAIALLNVDTNQFLYKSSYANRIEDVKLLSSNQETLTITYNNEAYLMVTSLYNNQQLNMKFFVLIKENNLFKNINETIKENLQLLIITIFLSTFIIFFIITYMFKSLKKLTNNIKELSKEIDTESINNGDKNLDEIQEIKFYFDGFVELIKEDRQKLSDFNMNLKNKVDEEIQKNKEKEQMLFQQSKMAAMGEMIGNIAHQWRQPIAVISMWANNIIVDIDMEEIENENLRRYANKINEQTKHLSQTIDDFRNFFSPNKEKNKFAIKESIDKTMNLLTASFKTHNIEVIKDIKDVEIFALENELTQAILNIIKNAKDIIVALDNSKKLIFINAYKIKDNVIIEIIDNGGGVPKEIKDKIFEPYFTTKHKSQGTGIGLYMTESIITKHLHGEIGVENVEYKHNDIDYLGAKFTIKLPIN